MRFSVFCGQEPQTLAQADEIYLRQKDFDLFIDLIDKYTNKDFVLDIVTDLTEDQWKMLNAYNQKITGKIYCSLHDIYLYEKCKKYHLPFFYAFPINSYFELHALKELGVSYLRLGMPLFFDLSHVKTFNIPIRITPNKAYDAYIPRKDGIAGQWVRPEDLKLYEDYGATICEFRTFEIPNVQNHLIYERTLLHIYKDRKEWPGPLSYIIKDLNNDANNSLLEEDIGIKRLTCGQKCQLDLCHYCHRAFDLANTIAQLKK